MCLLSGLVDVCMIWGTVMKLLDIGTSSDSFIFVYQCDLWLLDCFLHFSTMHISGWKCLWMLIGHLVYVSNIMWIVSLVWEGNQEYIHSGELKKIFSIWPHWYWARLNYTGPMFPWPAIFCTTLFFQTRFITCINCIFCFPWDFTMGDVVPPAIPINKPSIIFILILRKTNRDSITECMKHFHWLPIEYRIRFKLLTLTHKCPAGIGPKYLCNHLTENRSARKGRRWQKLSRLPIIPRTKYKHLLPEISVHWQMLLTNGLQAV